MADKAKITIRKQPIPGGESPLASGGAERHEMVDHLGDPKVQNSLPEEADTDGPFGTASDTDRANEEGISGMNQEIGINKDQDEDNPPELDIDRELRKNNQN